MRARLLAALLLACAGAASAQVSDAPRPKRRAMPPAVVATPAPAAPVAPAPSGSLALPGLASLPSLGDGGSSCRSACARTRYTCEASEDACAAPWAACVKSCGDVRSSGATALLPR